MVSINRCPIALGLAWLQLRLLSESHLGDPALHDEKVRVVDIQLH